MGLPGLSGIRPASPNPTKDYILVTIPESVTDREVFLSLYDSNGGLVKTKASVSPENTRMDIQDLPSVIYLLQARTSEGTGVVKVVKN
jgi:hypothetical protein